MRRLPMKTVKFEDLLKEYDEMFKQSEHYAKAYKAMTDAYVARLLLDRYPNATLAEVVIREAEALAEAFIKSAIEEGARRAYCSIVSAPEPSATKQ
jgi:HEPN domain-containing protein